MAEAVRLLRGRRSIAGAGRCASLAAPRLATATGVPRRLAANCASIRPKQTSCVAHQLLRAHPARARTEGVPVNLIQRQLGHAYPSDDTTALGSSMRSARRLWLSVAMQEAPHDGVELAGQLDLRHVARRRDQLDLRR